MGNILIVDDDMANQGLKKIYTDVVQRGGHTPRTATNGQEALEIICNQSINLIILDLQIPVMDGGQLLVELERRKLSIPVIMNSVELSDRVELAVKELGYKHVV